MVDLLQNHSEGYAKDVADQRMAGFDGAMSRLEGATKNLESALGRTFDNGGKGGFLTGATDVFARAVQALAELPGPAIAAGTAIGAMGAAFAGFKGVEALMGGFGLKGSAAALTEAAHALMVAAGEKGTPLATATKAASAEGGALLGGATMGSAALGGLGVMAVVGASVATDVGVANSKKPGIIKRSDDAAAGLASDLAGSDMDEADRRAGVNRSPTGGASLDGLKRSAFETKDALTGLNGITIAPQVDASGLKAASAEADAPPRQAEAGPICSRGRLRRRRPGRRSPHERRHLRSRHRAAGRTPSGR